MGDTFLLVANTTAPVGVQATDGVDSFRIQNAGSEVVYLSYAATGAKATTDAVIPTAGVPQRVVPISGGATEVLSFGSNPFFSGITPTTAVNVFITPGKGL